MGYRLLAIADEETGLKPVEQTAEGALLRLRVQPRASRNQVIGLHGDAVRIALSAPPVAGAANEALIRFLAERLDIPRSTIRLVSGENSRSKVVAIRGTPPEAVAARLGL
jgi:uncharacterized protein (TIGR00251 family)